MQKIICTCCGQEISKADRFCPNCAENNEYYDFVSSQKIIRTSQSVAPNQSNLNHAQNIKNNSTVTKDKQQILASIYYFSNTEKVKIWLGNEGITVDINNYNNIVIRVKNFLNDLVKTNLSKFNYESSKINSLLAEINSKYSWDEIQDSDNLSLSKMLALISDILYKKTDQKFTENVIKNQRIIIECVNLFIDKNAIEIVNSTQNGKNNNPVSQQVIDVTKPEIKESLARIKSMSQKDLKQIHNKLLLYGFKGFVHAGDYSTVKQILLTNKVLSRLDAKGKFKDIANQEIIANTSEFVKSKVRFYYAANTPAYYHFDKKSSEFVILQFDFSLVEDYEVYFLDGNAASDYSKKSQSASEIMSFDWSTIFGRGPIYDIEDKIDVIRKRDAELLVKGPVYVDKYLRKIIVKNENVAKKIKHDFPKYSGIIIVDPHSFC